MALAQRNARSLSVPWNKSIQTVFNTCVTHHKHCPNIYVKQRNPSLLVSRWIRNYKNGYEKRPTKLFAIPSHTHFDEIIDNIIQTRLPYLSRRHLQVMRHSHRLYMSAENLTGNFLEEYLAKNLTRYGWACAWGHTLRSIDFCNKDGRLLQIKNRNNTENSSSNKVRKRTNIIKWNRMNAQTGQYCWKVLENVTGASLTEQNFRSFVLKSLRKNPLALTVNPKNPWVKKSR